MCGLRVVCYLDRHDTDAVMRAAVQCSRICVCSMGKPSTRWVGPSNGNRVIFSPDFGPVARIDE